MLKNITLSALLLCTTLITVVLVWSAVQQFGELVISSSSVSMFAPATPTSTPESSTDTQLPKVIQSLNQSPLPFTKVSLTEIVHIPVFTGSTTEDVAVAKRINDTLERELLDGETIAEWKVSEERSKLEGGPSHNPFFLEYTVSYPVPGLIQVEALYEYCAMSCSNVNSSFVFIRSTGQLLTPKDVFTTIGWQRLGEEKDQQKKLVIDAFVAKAQAELLKVGDDKDERDRLETQINDYPHCVAYDYEGYDPLGYADWLITSTSTTFIDGACFPRVVQAYDDLGAFTFTKEFADIKDYLTPLGKVLFVGLD